MGPKKGVTARSQSKDFKVEDSYPDEDVVYEVSDLSLSSCDFKELQAIEIKEESIFRPRTKPLTKEQSNLLKHRFRSFKLNWKMGSRKRELVLKEIRVEQLRQAILRQGARHNEYQVGRIRTG